MNKYIISGGIGYVILFAGLAILFSNSRVVEANPSQVFIDLAAPATTTVTGFIGAGTGTTTDVFDTQSDFGFTTETAFFALMQAASSTNSQLNINIQYSQNGIDWFSYNQATTTTSIPTGTTPYVLNIKFASTTNDGQAVSSANSATSSQMFKIETPTRYVRAVVSAPVGSAGSYIWTAWYGKKQK